MDDEPPDDLPPRLIANSRLVARACDQFFSRKGLHSYDLKGNKIDPITKQLIHPKKKCKRSSKGSKR